MLVLSAAVGVVRGHQPGILSEFRLSRYRRMHQISQSTTVLTPRGELRLTSMSTLTLLLASRLIRP
jgi:hypothetical protein